MTRGELLKRLTYNPETGVFRWREGNGRRVMAGDLAGTLHRSGYICININRQPQYAHRLAWLYVHGEWPAGEIEHINGERADNRISNLRDVSRAQSNRNRRQVVDGPRIRGIRRTNGGWAAWLTVDCVPVRLGEYETFDAAVAARKEAERLYG